jgi:hypothetical protein
MNSKYEKSANITHKKITKNIIWGIKNAEVYAVPKYVDMGSKKIIGRSELFKICVILAFNFLPEHFFMPNLTNLESA